MQDLSELGADAEEILLVELLAELQLVADGVELQLHEGVEEEDILASVRPTCSLSLSVSLALKLPSRRKRLILSWLVSKGVILLRTGKLRCSSSIFLVRTYSSSLSILVKSESTSCYTIFMYSWEAFPLLLEDCFGEVL